MYEEKSAARIAAELVHPLFAYHGWTWGVYGSRDAFVPSVEDIEEEYERLSEYLNENNSRSVATGRLRVIRGDREQGLGEQYLLDVVEINVYSGEAMV